MRKRIQKADTRHPPKKRSRGLVPPKKPPRWKSELLLFLEGKDPKLLDKETYKVYRGVSETGARIQGPFPLPVQRLEESPDSRETDRVHRRLFRILFPTEQTVSLLEELALSGSIQASITVEEVPEGGNS